MHRQDLTVVRKKVNGRQARDCNISDQISGMSTKETELPMCCEMVLNIRG